MEAIAIVISQAAEEVAIRIESHKSSGDRNPRASISEVPIAGNLRACLRARVAHHKTDELAIVDKLIKEFKEIAMSTTPIIPMKGLRFNRETAPAFWMIDILWVLLVDGNDTGGAYSVIEQWMRKGSGALIPHVHAYSDEWFYVFDGELSMTVGDESFTGRGGDSVWIPRGAVHHFKVESEVCHVLNGYTPAGFEQVIKGLALPAQRRELPPEDFPKPSQETVDKIFNNYWCAQADVSWANPHTGMR